MEKIRFQVFKAVEQLDNHQENSNVIGDNIEQNEGGVALLLD